MKSIELLAPAGNLESLIGAINAGANAVYLAGKRFGARAFSNNFDDESLIDAIRYAHLRGVFVYVTINTLIFDDEVEELISFTDMLVENDVDALIVQDLGMMDLLIKRYPSVEIHASTQMNIHNINQVKFLKELGVKRIVMARETPLSIIKHIRKTVDIELEVFVHGALCVSYSGNCLMSSMLGGRSGNRGECAQPCRLNYRLFKEDQAISDQSYLLSTKDLMTLEYIDLLIEAGVDSFKIEGRMRKPEYVIQSVLSYRKAIDSYQNQLKMKFQAEIDRLKRVFNREYTKGYIFEEEPNLINNQFRPNHLGVPIGTVINYQNHRATIQLSDHLSVNDGYRIIGETDYGNQVSRILLGSKLIQHAEAGDIISLDVPETVSKGSLVVKTLDIELEHDLSIYLNENYKTIGLTCYVKAHALKKMILEINDGEFSVEVESKEIIQKADKSAVSESQIIEQISKLGNTPFYFLSLRVDTDGFAFIPIKVINELRREALSKLTSLRVKRHQYNINNDIDFGPSGFEHQTFELVVKVTNEEQLSAAIDRNMKTIYYDDLIKVERYNGRQMIPSMKRIQFYPKSIIHSLSVINEIGSLYKNNHEVITNEFLNVTNIYSAHLLSKFRAIRVTLSPELSKERILKFSNLYEKKFQKKPNLELVVYGHIDLMISKYCPIAKTYRTKKDCHLCEINQYYLQDRMGMKLPLINDGNCNIRILNSKALNLIEHIAELRDANINTLRLDFTIEKYHDVTQLIKAYQQAENGGKMTLNTKAFTTGRFFG
ncbi:MAG: U32 family peptidase [Acholeplasmataceae bacterium]|nr:U32 family peptidase [Acholeplasmataceae bacterium]